jgi:glycosyltransferase involved in cell wall biosynthesis
MKIVHLLWGLSTGGIENMLVDIVNQQVDGNEISLVVINDMIDESIKERLDKRVRVYCCGRKLKSKNPLPLLKLNFYLWKTKPEIVHVHYDKIARLVLGRKTLVRTIHNTKNNIAESKCFKACYAISKAVEEEWRQAGVETILVENGILCNRINYQRNGLFNDDMMHFVQVSRLVVVQKGQDILLNALAEIKRHNLCVMNFKMHFVGDGPSREMLQEMVTNLGIGDMVVFEGNKPRAWVYENLCNFDLFIQASRYEGFGLTVAEAMVAKVPVLASCIEGPIEIMSIDVDGERMLAGYVFEPGNPTDLAKQIVSFVQHGRDKKIVELGRQHVLLNYNVQKTALRYLEEYRKVLDGG